MDDNRFVRWFCELGRDDVAIAGAKGANLGELARTGLPVPPGFVITTRAYQQTMRAAGLRSDLQEAAAATGSDIPLAHTQTATTVSKRIRDVTIPAEIAEPILAAYRELAEPAVAVRSSTAFTDTAGTSFAGMNETYTNVLGEAELLTCLKDCWASAYGARVITYRAGRHLTDEPAIAVVVQAMVQAERSGVIFSADPTTSDRGRVLIEGAFGLGEVVVDGQLVPDTYVLDHHGPRLLEIRIGYKDHKIINGPAGGDLHVALPPREATSRVLSDDEAVALARLARQVQDHFGRPQELGWAIQDGISYLLSSRPITTFEHPATAGPGPHDGDQVHGQLVTGRGTALWIASGTVRVLSSPESADRFQDGEILVTAKVSPEWMSVLRRAAALVSDGGGVTCHAAILSRELGIPGVVGTRTATQVLHDGQQVTVDGRRGVVEEGTRGAEQ
jgi:pyruvate,water dikinase